MDDEQEDIGTGTHVEDSRKDPLVGEDDKGEGLIDVLKGTFRASDEEAVEGDEEK